ncbi:hypothetical protein [Rhizosaccharibacter radicis]|uniref:Uncharacterized protein n=1 Tax=Rhizosaccharibacter radicis TaxID=2782605 RepID=A0ABT1W0M8_9PROT|nr:hypothetical protein [Acetobacteraceae bacterium KSS12]
MPASLLVRRLIGSRAAELVLLGGLAATAATPALAQHVVTDDEAGKLTLESLTATPRPVYRPVVAYRVRSVSHAHGHAARTVSAVREASYSRKASAHHAPAARRAARHRG